MIIIMIIKTTRTIATDNIIQHSVLLQNFKSLNPPHQTLFDQYTLELSKTLSKGRASGESIILVMNSPIGVL